jgi:hypothetical protein
MRRGTPLAKEFMLGMLAATCLFLVSFALTALGLVSPWQRDLKAGYAGRQFPVPAGCSSELPGTPLAKELRLGMLAAWWLLVHLALPGLVGTRMVINGSGASPW